MNRSDIISNILFWMVFCSFLVLQFSSPLYNQNSIGISIFIGYNLCYIILFYIHYIVLIPKILMGNYRYKILIYLGAFVSTILVTAFAKTVIQTAFRALLFKEYGSELFNINTSLIIGVFTSGLISVVSLLLKFTSEWFNNEKKRLRLELEHKEMELAFLRSQLNPHFLFNVLNNIYALAVQKSEQTADMIVKLSDMMRYVLYESNEQFVSLDVELDYLNNYIELQKLRYGDNFQLFFEINGIISQQKIIPLLLISFVENVFKHGEVTDDKFPASIEIICNPHVLHLTVKNKKKSSKKDSFGGIGMENVERRLELMYPNRYTFNVINTKDIYASELIIEL